MKTIIQVENGDTLKALQGFLRRLLESGVIEALLLPMRTSSGTISPALVADPGMLTAADPLAPVLPVNAAALVGRLSARTPHPRIGAVLRACELRALVELTKVQQACLDDLTLIALDCAGTYPLPVYERQRTRDGGDGAWRMLFRNAEEDPEQPDEALRQACKICEQPVYSGAAISIELFGSRLDQEIGLSLADQLGDRLGLSPTEPAKGAVQGAQDKRAHQIENLVAARTSRMEAELAALRTRLEGGEGLLGLFAACICCHNCMTVCPICYCKTCVFMSALFDHDPMQYIHSAKQKGAVRLPADTMLFHLTRMNHMALSCVGCGMCTEACPWDLPVGLTFRAIGQRLGAVFGYAPGRNPDEPLPLSTFKADEMSGWR